MESDMKEGIVKEFLSTIYVVRGGNVLLTYNRKVNKFISLGGHVEENELPCDSAIREAKEESGFDVEIVDAQDWQHKTLPQNLNIQLDVIKPDHHHINISYVGKIVGGEMLSESDEGTELKWFSVDELKNCEDIFENTKENAIRAIEIFQKFGGEL